MYEYILKKVAYKCLKKGYANSFSKSYTQLSIPNSLTDIFLGISFIILSVILSDKSKSTKKLIKFGNL